MKTTIIPTIAVQEFYDELALLMRSQPAEWQAIAADQKELRVTPSDFEYYVTIRQQMPQSLPIATDEEGVPIVYFYGIRVKPLPHTRHPIP